MTPRTGALGATAVLWCALASAAEGQTVSELSTRCSTGGGAPAACSAMGLAARQLAADLGLAAGFGSEVAGTASNLGQRLGAAPRLAFGARVGLVRVGTPDVRTPTGSAEASYGVPALHVDGALGLFDGFRLLPTVGGFLSLDLFARLAFLSPPSGEGFDGSVTAVAFGARVGLLRESFTLPGVSVSVARRTLGRSAIGPGPVPEPVALEVDPAVTSLRATVGKDLFAVEVLAGAGWDDVSSDVTWAVTDGLGLPVAGAGSLDATRLMYFVGGARSFGLVLFLSLEVGFADGFDPVAGYTGPYDASRRSWFGSLAGRLTI